MRDSAPTIALILDRAGRRGVPRSVVGIGDAECDHDLLSLCGCSVAVANPISGLQQRADVVTASSYGAAALEVIRRLIDKDNLC
jgi:hydroxymethylpyrimidine pyrophosphatase-like HAD family hydrolase